MQWNRSTIDQLRRAFLAACLDVRHLVYLDALARFAGVKATMVGCGDLLGIRVASAGFGTPRFRFEESVDDRSIDGEDGYELYVRQLWNGD